MKQRVLLTPGPLTTSARVKQAMQVDAGTRDKDYQDIVQNIRHSLLQLAHAKEDNYSCVLLQGSGTYGVESVLTSTIRNDQKLLILANGSYGQRMEQICKKANVPYVLKSFSMIEALPITDIEKEIAREDITHVAYIHCETTAGVLNDIKAIQAIIHKHGKISIVDAMSSFASVEISIEELGIDYLITSSNKCMHGVPGIAIVFARRELLDTCKDISHSLSLDLYAQYYDMETSPGSFRFTSPTHVILALQEAILELEEAGGIVSRSKRYYHIQKEIYDAMSMHGFDILVDRSIQSPVITTYLNPQGFNFDDFYAYFKEHGFLLYSGKLPGIDAFRIGNIGHIMDEDIVRFKQLLDNYKGYAK
ncbi:MAG: 2-aminoethylphosphonate--pyruvate transaminase [Longicatena sp.]